MLKKKKSSIELTNPMAVTLKVPQPELDVAANSEQLFNNSQQRSMGKQNDFNEFTSTFKQKRSSSTVSNRDVSSQDEQNYERQQQQRRTMQIQKKKLIEKKMVIGSGFSLDMSDFFKFKAKKKIEAPRSGILQYVTGGHLAWIILLYSVCNTAIMPAWIMSIKANKILRISWRFLLQAIVMIPFVLYERRTGNQSVKSKYQLAYIFKLEGLRKVFISSLGTSIWFTIILSCFQWTYISHSLVLGSLSNFFLSISRSISRSTHQLEPGGQIFVIVGIFFILTDSYTLNVLELPSKVWNVINPYYLTRQSISRVIADLSALSGAFILSRFSQMTADMKSYYPPFLAMLLVNVLISFNVGLSAYFVNGATFDRDTDFGVWGLFTDIHFGAFFYMAVILSMGTYIGMTLISKFFSDPIIPALAMTLQPFFATFFLNLVSVQSMPESFSIYGYIFLICGLFLILIGQFLLQKQKQSHQKQMAFQKQMKEKFQQTSIKVIKQQDEQLERLQSRKTKKVKQYNQIMLKVYSSSDVIHV